MADRETITERVTRLETRGSLIEHDILKRMKSVEADLKTLIRLEDERRGALMMGRFVLVMLATLMGIVGGAVSHILRVIFH